MTEAEELELLELEEKEAHARAARVGASVYHEGQETAPEGMSAGAKLLAGIGGGAKTVLMNAQDIAGRIPSGVAKALGVWGPTGEAMRPTPEQWADQKAAVAQLGNDPKHSTAVLGHLPLVGQVGGFNPGNVGNFLGETMATAPLGGIAGAATKKLAARSGLSAAAALTPRIAARLAPLTAEGMTQGSVLAGPGHRLEGGVIGGMLGSVLSGAGAATSELANGMVRPTVAADFLRSRGVPLSLGQMEPGGVMSRLEEAGRHSVMGGQAIEHAHQSARAGWQNAAMREALPPGVNVEFPLGEAVHDRMGRLYEGFNRAYEPIRNTPVSAYYEGRPARELMSEAFHSATTDPSVLADEANRNMVNRYLQNQATTLDRVRISDVPGSSTGPAQSGQLALPASTSNLATRGETAMGRPVSMPPTPGIPEPGPTGTIPAGALMAIRSNIRGQGRKLLSGTPNYAASELLGNGEDIVSRTLADQLPPEQAAALRGIDARYARYKTLEKAVAASGDQPNGFTPAQLSAAVRAAEEKGSYARGGGGALRELAAAGREVLDHRQPATGAIKQTLPIGLNHAAGPIAAFANRPGVKAALLGETEAQARLRALVGALRSPAGRAASLATTTGAALENP